MRFARLVLLILTAVAAPAYVLADTIPATISGEYLETRTAEIFAGPCIANSEVNVVGKEAILSWRVSRGSWEGVPVDGMTVVAAVKANGTIGDPYENPYPAKAVLIVDERATAEQRRVLVDFARAQGGPLLDNIVSVEPKPIQFEEHTHGSVVLTGGDILRVETRNMTEDDHLCGNAELCYPPVTNKLSHSMPVFSLKNDFTGAGLGIRWRVADKSSAFIGTFSF
jgi:hypothetical protein